MRKVFADANYWIGLFNPRDQLHAIALTASRSRLVFARSSGKMRVKARSNKRIRGWIVVCPRAVDSMRMKL